MMTVQEGQPVSLVDAFEAPIRPDKRSPIGECGQGVG